ncbi:hypothetical protein KSP40_PGU018493 [Platanthera guangdongensis]|uniref:DUF4378 domain-containing protein n=1 Tax=Platanthera guangdongensis TaxID=2320717 RepID=A0ABR2MLC3_9ASPA
MPLSCRRRFNNPGFQEAPYKSSGMPIKTLIDEEMSREKHTRRSSPSLIARLMGLDTLPSPGAFKPLKEVRSFSKKVLSKDFHDNSAVNGDSESKSDEHQEEFKDVFEVVQVPRVDKQKDQSFLKESASLRRHEIGKASIPQSFSDATSYSTYRMPRKYRETDDDSVEGIDHNNDMFVPILKESSKHLHDQSRKSSFRSGKNVRMHINRRGNDSQSSRKLAANGYDDASREHMCSILHKFAQSTYAEKNGCSTQPTQIVILKPSLGKSQKAERTRSLNHLQYGLKNPMKFPVGEIMESFIEERGGGQSLHDKLERMGHKIQKPKEISKRNTLSCDRQKVSIQNYNEYEKDNGMCAKSTIMKGKNTQFSLLASAIDCEYSNNYSHSTSSPTESLATTEARKRLSERWKSTNDFQEMGFLNRESNTLAEMLALSEIDTPKLTPDALAVKKIAGKKSDSDDFIEHRNHPLGISSKDGSKDDFFRSLPRSKSLQESTSAYVNFQLNSRNRSGKIINRNMLKKADDLNNWMPHDNDDIVRKKNTTLRNLKCLSSKDEHHSDGEENTLAEREIHVSSEELKSSNNLRYLSEKHAAIEPLDDSTKRSDSAEIFSVSQSNTEMNGFEKLQYLTKSGNIVKQFECDEHEFPPKEASVYHDGDQIPASPRDKSPSVPHESFKDADQPSPVSVLEAPFEEDEFATGCFEKISADLQELRMQLRLLKQESPGGYKEEDEVPASSDEDEDMLQLFRDEEQRDYSYILDMLIDCEILKSSEHFPTEYPVDLHVFEELEKKYKSVDSWSRSDRKLLFDLTNVALEDVVERNNCRKSRMVRDGLMEEVWENVVNERRAFDGRLVEEDLNGIKWADSVDGKELVGRHVEKMLQEDLVAGLVAELAASSLWMV